MTIDLTMLVFSAVLTWVIILTGSSTRTRLHTPAGMVLAFSNRADLPAASELAGRADRAAKNMMENLPLFAVLVLTAHVAGKANADTALGAQVFLGHAWPIFPCISWGSPTCERCCGRCRSPEWA